MSVERIRAIVPHVVDIPLKVPVETAHGRFTHQRSVVVRISLSSGIDGWGEVDPIAGFSSVSADEITAGISAAAGSFRGLDLADRSAWRERLDALRHGSQAVEMALLDAAAQIAGQPLNRLLGTPLRQKIPLAGWIGWGTPAEAAQLAARWQRLGFGGLKLKIGSGIEADAARVAAVREAVGAEMHLIVDAGEAYDADGAIALLSRVRPFAVAACEQPVPHRDLAALARIRAETGVPLILDESVRTLADLERAVAVGAVDTIKLKLIKHAGLQAAVALGMAAAECGVGCTVGHGFALGLTTLAEAHIASVLPNFHGPGEMVGPLKMRADIARPAPHLESGLLILSDDPGLGAHVDPAMLDRSAPQKANRGSPAR